MRNIIIALIMLAFLPSLALGESAAPYTEEALQAINKAITETPKVDPAPGTPREKFHKYNVEYFTDVFAKAGYSYSKTIDQIVDDMKTNPAAIPKDRETVYDRVYMLLHIMMYECDADKIDCLQFYPPKTQKSIQWFLKNSGFSAMDHEKTK